ncbi:MAG: 2Fe-2S iron-sulfur cluster binding domain-containing protein [Gemmatimonadales bacterium]|nr:2Fe-2S iron-sulfur cluster binding domain-containing protein [Gemmatimonadales bacterium]
MIRFRVNGEQRDWDGDPALPLLWYLRDELALTGTKFGCGIAACGACTVHLDGEAIRACVTPVSSAAGKRVTTIEGLSREGDHPVQRAWRDARSAFRGWTWRWMPGSSPTRTGPAPRWRAPR